MAHPHKISQRKLEILHSETEQKLAKDVKELTKESQTLAKEVNNLKNLEFIQVFKHPLKFMWFSFLKGLMVGFGSVLGATVLVALFLYILAKLSVLPGVGEYVNTFIKEIQESSQQENSETLIQKIDDATTSPENSPKIENPTP